MRILTADELNYVSGQGIGSTLAIDAGGYAGGGAGMLAGRFTGMALGAFGGPVGVAVGGTGCRWLFRG